MNPGGSKKSLPEERLLRLIRGKDRPAPAKAPPAVEAAPRIPLTVGALAAVGRRVPWSRIAIGVLGVVLIVEIVLLTLAAFRPLPMVEVPVVPPMAPSDPAVTDIAAPAAPSLAPFASSALFTSPMTAAVHPDARSAPSTTATQLASRLSVLGIVDGDPPQVIIEDSKTKKTHFVTTGQTVVEGAVLESVKGSSVILDLFGEKIELTL